MQPGSRSVDESGPQPVRLTSEADRFVMNAYSAHYDEVYAFLARGTREPTVAEELLQETFLRLTEEARMGRQPAQTRAWLYRVASNLLISRSRRVTTARRWLEGFGRSEHERQLDESPERRFLRQERTSELDRAMARLSADARTALLLSSDGFSGEEIAALIGRSHAATRTLLTRARIALRKDLATEVPA